MDILIALGVAVAFALVFRTPLIRMPAVFYVLAVAVALLFLSGILGQALPTLNRELLPFLRRCIFPYALFVVVMYMGVLPEASCLRQYLKPARGPLSIVAALLVLCHGVSYLGVYLNVALGGFSTASASTASSLAMAVALSVILGVLTVTSFNFVRHRMRGKTWKVVQKAAYAFFGLVTAHAVVLLLPASLTGGSAAFSVSVYMGVFLLYVILRIARWAKVRYAAADWGTSSVGRGAVTDCELELA
ncbi:hypothetical protein [Adlercreutzia shanghongiae]|uniref:Ferric oxidoreductase domain-containing protein n=1 Tax=Adlercreutzia shanghongiae TaxID=3111773 RepID=A0ABU6IVQ5_9ACTN|nr:hypothetical protein [Adlercreutzia sp. R22]MEC4293907.1 hypothetical protein [Adlercreutzia sp. R22]